MHQLGKIMFHHAARACLLQALHTPLARFFVLDGREQFFHVNAVVPHVQSSHLAEHGHVFAVGTHAGQHRVAGAILAETVVAAGEDEAGRQAFHVPFPGGWQRLVQVVDVEDHAALRGGIGAEVEQMSVAASLHAQAADWCIGQIRSHVERRAAIPGERGLHHAPIAHRDQLRNPPLARFLQQHDRVGPIGGGLPGRVRGPRALFA